MIRRKLRRLAVRSGERHKLEANKKKTGKDDLLFEIIS